MPCYHPLQGWYAKSRNESGKRSIVFSSSGARKDWLKNGVVVENRVQIPCGRCIGCRLEKARQWALRCVHESKLWDDNCFFTLTYDDKSLPDGGTLVPDDLQLFMKRLRKHFGNGIRFFACGEYGDELGRPHYHGLLFNFDFPDKRFFKCSESGSKLYTSERLDAIWGRGYGTIGAVTFESAGYVARYALKKITGPPAESHYNGKVPEFLRMSRRPGIGREFVSRFASDLYPSDECVVDGRVSKPPRYYDNVMESVSPEMLAVVKERRKAAAAADEDNSGGRLLVREEVKIAAVSQLNGTDGFKVVPRRSTRDVDSLVYPNGVPEVIRG